MPTELLERRFALGADFDPKGRGIYSKKFYDFVSGNLAYICVGRQVITDKAMQFGPLVPILGAESSRKASEVDRVCVVAVADWRTNPRRVAVRYGLDGKVTSVCDSILKNPTPDELLKSGCVQSEILPKCIDFQATLADLELRIDEDNFSPPQLIVPGGGFVKVATWEVN